MDEEMTKWANWALMDNDALFDNQIPQTLRELHGRIKQAIRFALEEQGKKNQSLKDGIEKSTKLLWDKLVEHSSKPYRCNQCSAILRCPRCYRS